MEKCSNQKEINLMSKALYGNGRAGLIETTAHISTKVGYIETQIDAMRADIKVLLRYQSQDEAVNSTKKGFKSDKMWMYTSIISTVGLIIAFIKSFF